MATIVQSYTNEGSATQAATAGVPAAQVVAITDGEGSLSPTLRASAGGAAIGQTLQQFTGNPALSTSAATTVALFTVPAGKTFYITDVGVWGNAATATQFLVQIQAAGSPILFAYCKTDTSPVEFQGIETQPQASAGQAVQLVLGIVASATTAAYYIAGFVQ